MRHDRLVEAAMHKDPAARISALELADELAALRRGETAGTRARATRALAGLGALLLAAILGGLGVRALAGPESASDSPRPKATKPAPSATPTPRPVVSRLALSSVTFAASKGLQVRSGWGLEIAPEGLRFRSARGMSAELSLPFEVRAREWDLHVRATVPYMSPRGGYRFELVPGRALGPTARPGGPALLRVQQRCRNAKNRLEHGLGVYVQDAEGRVSNTGKPLGFREHLGPSIPLEFVLEVRPERVTLVVLESGERLELDLRFKPRRPYRFDLRPSPNRYEVGYNTEDERERGRFAKRSEAWPERLFGPECSELVLERLELRSPERDAFAPLVETHEWARIGHLERAALAGAPTAPLLARARELLSSEGNTWVRNEAGLFCAAFERSASLEHRARGIVGLHQANFAIFRTSGPRETKSAAFQEWPHCLDDEALAVFVEAYRLQFLLALEPEAWLQRAQAYLATRQPPARPQTDDLIDALCSALAAKAAGLQVDPVLLGRLWLDAGDVRRAFALLSGPAEQGQPQALVHGGLAAYRLREFRRAAHYWEQAGPAFPPLWRWMRARAERVVERGGGR